MVRPSKPHLEGAAVALSEEVVHDLVVDLVEGRAYSHRHRGRQRRHLLEKKPHRSRNQALGAVANAGDGSGAAGGGRRWSLYPIIPGSNATAGAPTGSEDLLAARHGVGLACACRPVREDCSCSSVYTWCRCVVGVQAKERHGFMGTRWAREMGQLSERDQSSHADTSEDLR